MGTIRPLVALSLLPALALSLATAANASGVTLRPSTRRRSSAGATYLNLGSSPGRVGPAVAATSTRPARWPAGRQPFSSGLGTGHRQGSSEAQDVNTSCRSSAIGPEASRPRGTRCCGGVARKGSICIPSCGWTARCSTWARWEARKAMPSASTGSGRSSVRRGSLPATWCTPSRRQARFDVKPAPLGHRLVDLALQRGGSPRVPMTATRSSHRLDVASATVTTGRSSPMRSM